MPPRSIAVWIIMLSCLSLTSLVSYILFHSLAEMIIAVIAFAVFVVAFASRRYITNNYLLLVGTGFLFIGFLGLIHALAYKGMGVFPGSTSNLPTQLWLATRLLTAGTLLSASLLLWRRLNWYLVFIGYMAVASLLLLSIFSGAFPTAYAEGSGLTIFKIASEYAIIALFLIATIILYRNRRAFERSTFSLIASANIIGIGAELAFTLYVDVYGIINMLGHILVIVSFFLIFTALVRNGIELPYSLVFRSLKESEASLQKERDFAEEIISNAQAMIMVVDKGGKVLQINPYGKEIIGWDASEILSKDWLVTLVPEEDRSGIMKVMTDAFSANETAAFSCRLIAKDGKFHEMEWRLRKLSDPSHSGAVLFIGHDVSEERRLERSLSNRAEELARSNEDLRQFAYVASHDLQEPLRMVSNYIGLLERRYHGQLDDRAREYMDFALRGSERMRQLIEDLLEYSRVDTRGKEFAPTDMNSVVTKTLETLRTTINDTGASINFEKLPTIMADEGQMLQVIQNLIGNAIKFRGKNKPNVEISALGRVNGWTFSVKDNGIGIASEYHQKIFEMFHRLNDSEQYPGTGIGLAIAKKIVERHGGRIWVESEGEGKGSTFFFTIPKRV